MCEEILVMKDIRFTGVVSMKGKIIFASHKWKMAPHLSTGETESFLIKAAIRMGTREEFLDKLGGIEYSFTQYGIIKQFTIPLKPDNHMLLLVSADNNGKDGNNSDDFIFLLNSIRRIINKYYEVK